MTQADIELLRKVYEHERWLVKRSDDGKFVIGTLTLDVATTDDAEAANLIARMHNTVKDLIEENARLNEQLKIRKG